MAQNELGYLYLVDAENSRQYVLPYDDSGYVKPFKVFTGSGHEAQFEDNKTIYAFDDEIRIEYAENGVPTFTADAYRIHVTKKPNGDFSFDVKRADDIEFETRFDLLGSHVMAVMSVTESSARALYERGGFDEMPAAFTHRFEANDPRVNFSKEFGLQITAEALGELRIAPQHGGGALVARTAIEQEKTVNTSLNNRKNSSFNAQSRPDAPANKARLASLRPQEAGFKVSDSDIESVMKKYCDDLTAKAQQGKLDPVVGRDQEVEDSLTIMLRREQASLCFTGDAGVGKSAMFSAIAQRLASNDDLPENMKNARVLQLDLQGMNAGAQFRGQFEQRLKPLIDGLQEREGWFKGRKIYLAIDEIHSQLTAGNASGGTDAGNMMKPFMASKGITVLGTTTTDEYRKHIEKDPALARRFEEKVLEQPSDENTFTILKEAVWPMMKNHHGLSQDLTDDDYHYIITMANRYAPNEAQPAKGKKVIDMAGANAQKRGDEAITRDDIIKAVAQMSKLSEDFLSKKDYERLINLEDELSEVVLGQEKAISDVVNTLIGSLSGLKDPNKPLGIFFFQGLPGVGKTELAKALARSLFGTEDALIKLDMADYQHEHEVAKLIGAPPGYVGFEDGKPALTDRIRSRPYSVLLLDEAEKAHKTVWQRFLAPFNDGEMTDNKGKKVSFRNVLVLMTSNLGVAEVKSALAKGGTSIDFDIAVKNLVPEDKKRDIMEAAYKTAIAKHFAPELIDRVEENGGFVTFNALGAATINKLVTKAVRELDVRLSDRAGANLENVSVEFSNDVMEQLAAKGYVEDAGARPLKGLVRKSITNPLAGWLLKNKAALATFADANGGARLVIDSISDFNPRIEAPHQKAAAGIANDNTTTLQTKRNRKSGHKPN